MGEKFAEAGRVGRSQKGFLLHEVHGILVFANGKKTKFLLGCSALAVLLVLWMERKWIFEDYRGAGVEELWDRVKFSSALWGSVSINFNDCILFCILLDWKAGVVYKVTDIIRVVCLQLANSCGIE